MRDFFSRPYWSVYDYVALGAFCFATFWVATPYIFPANQWIDLQKVEIADGTEGVAPDIRVTRLLFLGTSLGRYTVNIRDAVTHLPICSANRRPKYTDEPVAPLIEGKDIKWWAYSADGECERWAVGPGTYYAETRHCWKRFWWVREACNPWTVSNIFTITERRS